MGALAGEGLGLDYGKLRLDRTTEGWIIAGASLRDRVAECLENVAVGVEQIGSSSEAAKLRLAQQHGADRKAYTDGKSAVVHSLLRDVE